MPGAARKQLKFRAIVLLKTKLAEQDLILTLLAEDGSQAKAIAKGARKPSARLSSRCDLFCESELLVSLGKGLGIISDAGLLNSHAVLRGDYEKTSAASCACELARLTSFEESPDAFLYPILSRVLLAIEQSKTEGNVSPQLDVIVAAYAFKLTAHAGWRPELHSCVLCGDPHPTRLSASAGGALCESCAQEIEGAEPVAPSQLALIDTLLRSTFDQLLAQPFAAEDSAWLIAKAHIWAATHLDARLRAMEFYLGL